MSQTLERSHRSDAAPAPQLSAPTADRSAPPSHHEAPASTQAAAHASPHSYGSGPAWDAPAGAQLVARPDVDGPTPTDPAPQRCTTDTPACQLPARTRRGQDQGLPSSRLHLSQQEALPVVRQDLAGRASHVQGPTDPAPTRATRQTHHHPAVLTPTGGLHPHGPHLT